MQKRVYVCAEGAEERGTERKLTEPQVGNYTLSQGLHIGGIRGPPTTEKLQNEDQDRTVKVQNHP